ncbi:hypothetical protein DWQ65_11940 [Treponema phagedenis]|nr:hypothetical protein [Treponema phagedenis]NVP23567.1 hypothetical protein [Treponema phagedenis]QEJ94553.1 hypothetical protein FUT79_04605 [Treponema phagedenis]QEJ98701.1 hypothetical protein FUT82_12280 [Treponema phagedenis]QEK01570.1 hypothetical protein FUT84_10645 [Treponema phagedenis]QEK04206.1 hypothetical protein FUT83_10565 [Treponema phagedenis]
MAKKNDTKVQSKTKAEKTSAKKDTVKKTAPKKAAAKKTESEKKPAVKKNETKKSTVRKQTAAEKKLVKELTELLSEMDEVGLRFLIEQARVHLYNMEVISIQTELTAAEQKLSRQKLEAAEKTGGSPFRIEAGKDRQVYHIISGGKYKVFNDDEILDMVRIVHAEEDASEIRRNLYHWFFRERGDVLAEFGLADLHDSRWNILINTLQTSFKLKN